MRPVRSAAKVPVAYPRYRGYAVARQSRAGDLAWQFVISFAADPNVAKQYAIAVHRPPALLALKSAFENAPELGVFANQTLTARSWPQADPDAIAGIFSDMIVRAAGTPDRIPDILREGATQVTQLMAQRARPR